ncbi:MAG: hypothetical protein AAGA96_06245 [Verrucomicrobiota bacterium]
MLIFQGIALCIFALLSVSCTQDGAKEEVKSVTFVSPDGDKTELKLDNGDGKITSGFNGRNTHAEVRELYFAEGREAYVIITDSKTYRVPKTFLIEIQH